MPLISSCPECREPVTVPDGISLDAHVRCPVCAATYTVREAVPHLPPALIPVDAALASAAEAPDSTATAADTHEKADAVPPIDTGAPGRPKAGGADGASVDAAALSGLDLGELDKGRESAGAGAARRRPARRREKGPIRVLVEVVGGGLVGLTIGYYVACWAGLDMPRLPLPFLPHTMHWFQGPEQAPDQAPEDTAPAPVPEAEVVGPAPTKGNPVETPQEP